MNRLGNSSPGKKSVGTGSGSPHARVPFGHITIGGQANEKVRISAQEVFNVVTLGSVFIQTTGGAINVWRTLADIDLAFNPDHDSAGHWVQSATSLSAGTIHEIGIGTAFMIEFVSPAVVYISGV